MASFFPDELAGLKEPTNFRNHIYGPAIKQSGLRYIRFHDLRSTFITHCAEAGVPLSVIARWAGHTTTKVTEIYLQATSSAQGDALELLNAYDRRTHASTTTPH